VKSAASTVVEVGWKADQARSLKVAGDPLPVVTGSLAPRLRATISPGCVIDRSLTVVCQPRRRLARLAL
jgi:hypothetical protein